MKALVAIGQMTAKNDKEQNLSQCEQLIQEASLRGAVLCCLPENCVFLGQSPAENAAQAESLEGQSIQRLSRAAQRANMWISIGGFQESSDTKGRYFNTHVVIDNAGVIRAAYRKVHLFSVTLPDGLTYNEGQATIRGDRLALVKTPFGTLGLAICYDLRFGEMFVEMVKAGAEILLIPAAFTATTGKAHWEVLLRARAIECQSYVLAAAQTGHHHGQYRTHGHAMAIDPWGTILSQCGEKQGLAIAEVDLSYIQSIRNHMPVFQHRQFEVCRFF